MYATLNDEGTKIEERVEMSEEHNIDFNTEVELTKTYKHFNIQEYNRLSVVQGIELQGSTFSAYSDPRKQGVAAAYG